MALLSEFAMNYTDILQWRLLALFVVLLSPLLYFRRKKTAAVDIKQYSHIPQPAPADPVRAHWPWLETIASEGDPRRMFDEMLYEQAKKMDFPPVLLCDMRPLEKFLILFVFDNEVAEQITKPSKQYVMSMPKHPAIQQLAPLVGARSLVTTDGEEWKNLYKRIRPGFQPQYLLGHVEVILDKLETFVELMEQKSRTGEEFCLDQYTTNLVFDVIGIVTFDMDLNAQIEGKQSEVLLTYRALSEAFNKRPFGSISWKQYFSKNERDIRRLDKKLDTILKTEIKKHHSDMLAGSATASRSISTLSLQGIDTLTPSILQQTSDTLRGFLFAGHDTTSILLQWCFYLLHTHPSAAAALKAELDASFGPDCSPQAVMQQLRGPEAAHLLAHLPYTDAIIKETLRLHPPGTTARVTPEGSGSYLTLPDGERILIDGLCVTPRAYIIQRHPKLFGDTADYFVPDRWLGDAAAKIPESAFRPYERGPRRCTGSELANLEARMVLACLGRWLEFVKLGLGEVVVDEKGVPELDEKGVCRTKGRLFSTHKVTAKPVDGMLVKVRTKSEAGK